MENIRVMEGRSLDVLCVEGDNLASTEFVLYVKKDKLAKYVEEKTQNITGDDISDSKNQLLPPVSIYCNGNQIVDSLTGRTDSLAVAETSGRIAFIEPDGSLSYFPSEFILKDMNLSNDKPNILEFRNIELDLFATCQVWKWGIYDNICVVDIDGTVTIEDVMGYIQTVYLGMYTYIHKGIVSLLKKLSDLKLRLIFLTSRPVDHIHETRKFLSEVIEDEVKIPESPLFMSQDYVLEALYREVIAKNGAVIKAGILSTIKDAYSRAGRNSCPFLMGLGNKKSDGVAYSQSGVLPEYIFIINTYSELTTWQSESSFKTYQDPNFLKFIEASFQRPDKNSPENISLQNISISTPSALFSPPLPPQEDSSIDKIPTPDNSSTSHIIVEPKLRSVSQDNDISETDSSPNKYIKSSTKNHS